MFLIDAPRFWQTARGDRYVNRSSNLQPEEVIATFKGAGALLEGHFVLTSGLHSTKYLQCALVLQDPDRAEMFGRAIAEHFQHANIQLVASPAIGGIIIGHEGAP